eukprot:CAMPEP_0181183600 /NCGR_PEP_ID=MMETSP1096-20121128/8513_1 /TAXON_ID=156174 ORGANISM="Chrysochromulina ericina, Strain CCMP281" /NCGR_SAMPLE_ID=MMETSP1096 /ASSEMBLY_ACC=CAM_ASM_000453 /LENGTH=130 /DNA_ID=CAMNT_0023272293 /DNA_START=176 /DNA_END=568 /DNA_ORIENTATION=-
MPPDAEMHVDSLMDWDVKSDMRRIDLAPCVRSTHLSNESSSAKLFPPSKVQPAMDVRMYAHPHDQPVEFPVLKHERTTSGPRLMSLFLPLCTLYPCSRETLDLGSKPCHEDSLARTIPDLCCKASTILCT